MLRITGFSLFPALLCASFAAPAAAADNYPQRPIRPHRAVRARRRHRHQRAHPVRSGSARRSARRSSPTVRAPAAASARHRREVRPRRLYAASAPSASPSTRRSTRSCRSTPSATSSRSRGSDQPSILVGHPSLPAKTFQDFHSSRAPSRERSPSAAQARHRLAPRHDAADAQHQRGRDTRAVQGDRPGSECALRTS